jgi:hypothetical protein
MWFKTFVCESIVRFKKLDNQSRNLNWKIWSVTEWKISGNINSPSGYQYRICTRILQVVWSQCRALKSHNIYLKKQVINLAVAWLTKFNSCWMSILCIFDKSSMFPSQFTAHFLNKCNYNVNESRDINHSIHSRLSSMRGRRDLQLPQYAISKNVCSFFKVIFKIIKIIMKQAFLNIHNINKFKLFVLKLLIRELHFWQLKFSFVF